MAEVEDQEHAALVPRLTATDTAPLGRAVVNLEPRRDAILSAVDLLNFGV